MKGSIWSLIIELALPSPGRDVLKPIKNVVEPPWPNPLAVLPTTDLLSIVDDYLPGQHVELYCVSLQTRGYPGPSTSGQTPGTREER